MTQSKWVRVGSVRRFDHVKSDKAQALKVLEEAAEVLGAWQNLVNCRGAHAICCSEGNRKESDELLLPVIEGAREILLDECADVIQATLNLVAAYGVEDFRPYMEACERRNRERGRITDGWKVNE